MAIANASPSIRSSSGADLRPQARRDGGRLEAESGVWLIVISYRPAKTLDDRGSQLRRRGRGAARSQDEADRSQIMTAVTFHVDEQGAQAAVGVEHEIGGARAQRRRDRGFLEARRGARLQRRIGVRVCRGRVEAKNAVLVEKGPERRSVVLDREFQKDAAVALHRTARRRQ